MYTEAGQHWQDEEMSLTATNSIMHLCAWFCVPDFSEKGLIAGEAYSFSDCIYCIIKMKFDKTKMKWN